MRVPARQQAVRYVHVSRRAEAFILLQCNLNNYVNLIRGHYERSSHVYKEPGATVLVAGATGGVGQIVTAKLLERGYKVKALCRNREKAGLVLTGMDNLELVVADLRDPSTLNGTFQGVDAVACCTGTTAFPSNRWKDNNGPEQTDYHAVRHLVAATPRNVKRFILTTSAGIDRQKQIPFSILNLFGVLKWKLEGEKVLQESGIPFTILRPSRLTDGPYTSYDLNTLLKSTSGSRQDVKLSPRDDQIGEASRIAVAEAIVQALTSPSTVNQKISLMSTEGEGPGQDKEKWEELFQKIVQA
eukprot:jgi/Botrbrau1/2081/Bobra.0047s0042.2